MPAGAQVHCDRFGTLPDGTGVDRYTIALDRLRLETITYGGIITGLWAPDRRGVPGNVVLGYDTLEPYLDNRDYLGAIVGRYANRIAGGRFDLDGTVYQLAANDRGHHLHGGRVGFDRRIWAAEPFTDGDTAGVRYSRMSPDGEEGYPGTLRVNVTYRLRPGTALELRYEATCDRPTIVSLTQHSYFNLSGVSPSGTDRSRFNPPASPATALEHELAISADLYTPVDEGLIPDGRIVPVDGTPLDFRRPARIGDRLDLSHPQLARALGFDHNFVLRPLLKDRVAAELVDWESGRALQVTTSEPGLQLYIGQLLGGGAGSAARFGKHAGVCLETQQFPDAPNRPEFPSPILRPGEGYVAITRWQFAVV